MSEGTHLRSVGCASFLAAATLIGAGCSEGSGYAYVAPAAVTSVGDDLWEISLTEQAAARTGIETVEVAMEQIDGAERMVVPYSAVMYHFDGTTWTYTNPSPLTYVRSPISIEYIEGDVAVLDDGPAVGTTVVSVGAAELYGVEFGVGK